MLTVSKPDDPCTDEETQIAFIAPYIYGMQYATWRSAAEHGSGNCQKVADILGI